MSLSKDPQSVMIRPKRSLGTITAHVVVEESHDDKVEVTEHPVEQGASISDHAFKKPAELTLRLGWSNANAEAAGNSNYVAEIYDQLLKLQEKREPVSVVTGKRLYKNMLITGLTVTTDKDTEQVLLVTVTCREVIIVETMVSVVPPRRVHKHSGRTGGIEDRGTVQPRKVDDSALEKFNKAIRGK